MIFVQYQLPLNIEAQTNGCCLRIHIEDKRVPLSNSYRCVYCQHQYSLGAVYLDEARKSGCYKASECFFLSAPRCVLQSVYVYDHDKKVNYLHTEEGPPFTQVNSGGVNMFAPNASAALNMQRHYVVN